MSIRVGERRVVGRDDELARFQQALLRQADS
jgi:hypothetical protein